MAAGELASLGTRSTAGRRRRPVPVGTIVRHVVLVAFMLVILLPLAGALLMAVHFWRIRKDGGAAGPPPPSRRELEARTDVERSLTGTAR